MSTSTCVICQTPCSSAARNGCCSLRCSWKSSCQCVQCGRQVKADKLAWAETHPDYKLFCSALCLEESRRGSWCLGCGCKQVTVQGLSRCSNACMAVDVPQQHQQHQCDSSSPSSFPSRRTTPGDDNNASTVSGASYYYQQQRGSRRDSISSSTSSSSSPMMMMMSSMNQQQQGGRPNSREIAQNNNNNNKDVRPTVCPVQPGSKLWERITQPFLRSGLQCYQVIQINNSAADKKAYNAYRLSVDQKLAANGITKYGFGGEGNEHKRFVPLMAGCGSHLYGLRLAQQVNTAATSSSSSSSNNNNNSASASNSNSPYYHKNSPHHHHNYQQQNQQQEIEGYPCVCADPTCDVCRILEKGLKLTAVTGRTSHFSVPTLESVLPWCSDAGCTINAGTPAQVRFQAVALVRTVLGNVQVVNEFDQVSADQPPQGFDSVVCAPHLSNSSNTVTTSSSTSSVVSNIAEVKTDSAFNYNDQGILAEYIVLFTDNNNNGYNNYYQQQQQY